MSRPGWDAYWMRLAREAAGRSTCDEASVGCVLASPENRPLSTGYNGAPSKAPHCDEVGHLYYEGRCIRVTHAEMNAVAWAGREARGATAYVTRPPCVSCTHALISAGIRRLVVLNSYPFKPVVLELLRLSRVEVELYEEDARGSE